MQKSEQVTSLCVPGDSEGDEEETTQDEVSSHTSEEDGGVVKVEKELENTQQPVGGNEVVEHEASDSGSWVQVQQCPTLLPTLMLLTPVAQSLPLMVSWACTGGLFLHGTRTHTSDSQFSPHSAFLFHP